MVLAGTDTDAPTPTCMVRVLATRHGDVLTLTRHDGKGLDIPTVTVGDDLVEDCLGSLLVSALGSLRPATLLGYVRNTVNQPADNYPWPVPEAYFTVWHCEVPAGCERQGRWLQPPSAQVELKDRHWWPLAAHVLGRGTPADEDSAPE